MNTNKPLHAVILGLSLWMLAASSCTKTAPRSSQVAELSAAHTQADFDLMRKALDEAHPGLHRYVSESEMDRVFAAQRAKLDRPMSRIEFLAASGEAAAIPAPASAAAAARLAWRDRSRCAQ